MGAEEPLTAYRFGDFVLDPRAFRVVRGGRELPLEPKAVDVLLYLVERPGQLVSKEELIGAVWKGTAVTDNALTRLVAQLRRALGDEAHGARFIETVPTRGYRFIGQPTRTLIAEPSPVDAPATASTAAIPPAAIAPLPMPHVKTLPHIAAVVASVLALVLVWFRAAPFGGSNAKVGREGDQAAPPLVRSLAVLPLKNLTGDPAQDYFASGMTEALGDRLSRVSGLKVVALTSSVRYRKTTLAARQIASELRVDGLLEGAVVRDGDHVRVTVALVHGPTERRMWSATYDRPLENVLALYRDIALAAAAEMSPAVAATEEPYGRHPRPVNPHAYDAYLRATYFLGNRWMAGGCRDAERYLLRSIEIDPGLAPAHAALAWCYAYPDRTGRDIGEIGPRAKAEVARALELDDRLALAHVALGTIKWRVDYEPAAAETEFQCALALEPGSGLAHVPYGELLIWRGEREKGLAFLRRAVELDPFSPDRNVQVGFGLMTAGLYPAAIEQLGKALELDPHYLTARFWMAEAYGYLKDHDRAVSEYLLWLDGALRPARAAAARARLQRAYARDGWPAFWRAELALVEEDLKRPGSVFNPPYDRYTGAWYTARRHARLGDRGRALDALERAHRARHHMVATLAVEPLFEDLRDDARLRALLAATRASR